MTDGRDESPVRRSVVVTAILLVAVAVMFVAIRSWLDRPATDDEFIADAIVVAPQQASAPTAESRTNDEQAPDTIAADVAPEISAQSILQSGTLKVALLPARADDPDPAAALLADAIRQATLRSLRGMADVEVFDVGPAELTALVPISEDAERSAFRVLREANRQYGSGVAAEIEVGASNDSLCWAVSLDTVRSGTSGSVSTGSRIRRNGDPGPGNDPESVGIRYAAAIAVGTREREADDAGRIGARNVFIDATRSEDERIRALTTMMNDGRLDPESIGAAVELGTRSESPETRKQIWNALRTRNDAELAQPMRLALQSDPDAGVRVAAALGLGRHRDVEGIRPALAQAALGDPSADVRLAARMVTMDLRELRDSMLETLRDRSLTPAERMAPVGMFNLPNIPPFEDYPGLLAEAVVAYAEIISRTDDPDLQSSALSALRYSVQLMSMPPGAGVISGSQRPDPDPAVVRALIETASVADDRVQREALRAMRRFADHPEIRTVLESVLEADPELANELNIADALARAQDPTFGEMPPRC